MIQNPVKKIVWKYTPLFFLKLLVKFLGNFRSKEKLGMIDLQYYAYGLLCAADHAKETGVKSILALEFGVASGRGLKNLIKLSKEIEKLSGISIRVVGFDSGIGMPLSKDFRDHPERYHKGDFPMIDKSKLIKEISNKAELILGDINKTIDAFVNNLKPTCPVAFISVDVDTYNSSMAALKIFSSKNPENYLPMVFSYFDDSGSRSHFSKFTGELLSIEHFNNKNKLRKIDIDRGVRNNHKDLSWQSWFDRMFVTQIFDHPWRLRVNKRKPKTLPK